MTIAGPTGTRFLFILHHKNLGRTADLGDSTLHCGFRNIWGANSCIGAIVYEQNLVKNNLIAFLGCIGEFLNSNNITF